MKKLVAPTEDFIKLERSFLGADLAAGASNVIVNVTNNDGMNINDYLVIGYEGNELCEMVQINQTVTPGSTVRVAAVKFNHLQGEPVTKYQFNKRKFYGSTSASGTFFELTADGSPISIQVDDPQGSQIEYTGADGYTWFKATYFNSTSSTETSLSDSTAVLGDQSLRYASLYAIRKHAGLAGNAMYSDLRIEQKRIQAESEINSSLYFKYVLPLTEVPGLVTYVCELLAAGYIDYEEFGKDGEGAKWLGTARSILKDIKEGSKILVGADGVQLGIKTNTSGVRSYPDGVDNENGPTQRFTINQKF